MVTRQHPEFEGASQVNQLINGGFRVWQRGTSFDTTGGGGQFSADKWELSGELIASQVSDSKYGEYGFQVEDASTSNPSVTQSIENVADLRGQEIILSVWLKEGSTNPSSSVGLRIIDSDGTNTTGVTEIVTPSSTYERFIVSHIVQEDSTSLDVSLYPALDDFSGSATGEAIFDGVTLTVGPDPVDYPQVVRPIGQEQGLAERYYESQEEMDTFSPVWDYQNEFDIEKAYNFATTKAAIPSVTGSANQATKYTHSESTNDGTVVINLNSVSEVVLNQFSVDLTSSGHDGSQVELVRLEDITWEAEVT